MKIYRETRSQEIRRLSHDVEVLSVSHNIFSYTLKEYTISFDCRKMTQPWSCTCEYASLYRGTNPEQCKHIQAARMRVGREHTMDWRTDE